MGRRQARLRRGPRQLERVGLPEVRPERRLSGAVGAKSAAEAVAAVATAKTCACTGMRWCARCRDPERRRAFGLRDPLKPPDWLIAALPIRDEAGGFATAPLSPRVHRFDLETRSAPSCPAFAGVRVYGDAITPAEAKDLLATIDARPFVPSQSGKHKQHDGPRFNFQRRRMNAQGFDGLPTYAHALEARLRECVARDRAGSEDDRAACRRALDAYETTDAFVLRYFEREQSNLDFHVDDVHAYGEAILDVSLESDACLTFLGPFAGLEPAARLEAVRVPLPARSIAVVYGAARFDWHHAILPQDVRGVRTSITLRTLAPALRATEAGKQVLAIARLPLR